MSLKMNQGNKGNASKEKASKTKSELI